MKTVLPQENLLRGEECPAFAERGGRSKVVPTLNISHKYAAVVGFLSLAAAISVGVAVRHAFTSSFDFQWRAASLLGSGQDPWLEALSSHRDLTNSPSVPNYLHELYVLYLPLARLPERVARVVWMLLNFAAVFLSLRILAEEYRIPRRYQPILALAVASSVCFRAGIGAGQFCFAELLLFCCIYRKGGSKWRRGLSLGVSFAKYSFSPVIAFSFLLKRRVLSLLLACIPVSIGLIVCALLLHKSVFALAIEPLLVARKGVSPGFADLMTLSDRVFGARFAVFTYAGALIVSLLYAIRLMRSQASIRAEFAAVSVVSLLLFKHLIYDYVFLVVPLCYALWGGEIKKAQRWIMIVIIGYVWFGSPLYIGWDPVRNYLGILVINCLTIIALLLIIDTAIPRRSQLSSRYRAPLRSTPCRLYTSRI